MNETNIAGIGTFLLLLSIALGLLVVVGVALFIYRYNRLKETGQSVADAEMLRRAEVAWARDPANPANHIDPLQQGDQEDRPAL